MPFEPMVPPANNKHLSDISQVFASAETNIMAQPLKNKHKSNKSSQHRVLVIGAGPGGLAAALLLARAGLRVTVIEKQPHVGGRCSTITTPEGFRFDLGPTFFLYPAVLDRIYRLLGRSLFAEVPMVKLDPQYRIVFGSGGLLDCTPDPESMARAVATLSPEDGPGVYRFLNENREKLARFTPILETDFSSWTKLLAPALIKLLPLMRPWKSLDTELKRFFKDPRIRLAFSFQSKYLGMSPFQCPSLFSILAFLEHEFGVWHPYGGCGAVSCHMAELARELGVEILLSEPVTQVLLDGRRAVGVRTASGEYHADAVVMNADFAQAMTALIPNNKRQRWTNEKLARKRYSCSTFMMYLGLEGEPDPLPHHTIYTAADYEQNLRDIEESGSLSDDPSIYVQNPGVTDDSLAPLGCSTLYVLAPVPHLSGTIDWESARPVMRARVLRRLQALGFCDVDRRIRFEKIVTPQQWRDDYDVYRGATFNLAHNLGQMLHWRPHNRFEDIAGIYLVGGGTHPGSGLPVIYESARISCRLLLEDLDQDASWLDNITDVQEFACVTQ